MWVDLQSVQSYEYRRVWLKDRLLELPKVLAIDIAAYAIMSNQKKQQDCFLTALLARRVKVGYLNNFT